MESYLASDLEAISYISEKKKQQLKNPHEYTTRDIFLPNGKGAQPSREQAHIPPHRHLRPWSQRVALTPNLWEKTGTFLIGSAES